ncbi:hypothetical protein ACWDUM_14015 [Rhodococcus sp. NPDC003322]
MNLARRIAPAVLLVAAAVLTGCSSTSEADAAADSTCVDASQPNATAEELIDVLRPQPVGEPDDTYRQLAAMFDESRTAQIERMQASSVFTAVPEGGDAEFAKAVCGQSRWDDHTSADGTSTPGLRTQRAAIVSTGHTFCDTYEQLRPSAVSTDAWSDWNGYVEMMSRGDDSEGTRQLADAALEYLCPQFGA